MKASAPFQETPFKTYLLHLKILETISRHVLKGGLSTTYPYEYLSRELSSGGTLLVEKLSTLKTL